MEQFGRFCSNIKESTKHCTSQTQNKGKPHLLNENSYCKNTYHFHNTEFFFEQNSIKSVTDTKHCSRIHTTHRISVIRIVLLYCNTQKEAKLFLKHMLTWALEQTNKQTLSLPSSVSQEQWTFLLVLLLIFQRPHVSLLDFPLRQSYAENNEKQ